MRSAAQFALVKLSLTVSSQKLNIEDKSIRLASNTPLLCTMAEVQHWMILAYALKKMLQYSLSIGYDSSDTDLDSRFDFGCVLQVVTPAVPHQSYHNMYSTT
eukprot:4171-Heterococcus_DN1.PRE.3